MEEDQCAAQLPAAELDERVADVRKRAFAAAKRRVDEDEAEDIAQEIAEYVRKRLAVQPRFVSGPKDRQLYVARAVKNKCIDRRKAEKAAELREGAVGDHLYSRRSYVFRPDNFIDRGQDMALEWALNELPPQMGAIIERLYWLNQPASDVARELGITPQTVHTQKKRGLAKLKQMWLKRQLGAAPRWEKLHETPKDELTPAERAMILEVRRQFKEKGLPWNV